MSSPKCAISWNEKSKGYTRQVCLAAIKNEGFDPYKVDEQEFPVSVTAAKVSAEITKLSKGYLNSKKKRPGTRFGLLDAILKTSTIKNLPQCANIYNYVQKKMKHEDVQALLLPGGAHISPWLYGAEYKSATSKVIKEMIPCRTILELYMLKYADDHDLPVFGICRGAELINVFYGGSLVQKTNDDFEFDHEDHKDRKITRTTEDKTKLFYKVFKGKKKFVARSLHTQAIDRKARPAKGQRGCPEGDLPWGVHQFRQTGAPRFRESSATRQLLQRRTLRRGPTCRTLTGDRPIVTGTPQP